MATMIVRGYPGMIVKKAMEHAKHIGTTVRKPARKVTQMQPGLTAEQRELARRRREEKGWSQAELARRIAERMGLEKPLSQTSIWKWENADTDKQQTRLVRYAAAWEAALDFAPGTLQPRLNVPTGPQPNYAESATVLPHTPLDTTRTVRLHSPVAAAAMLSTTVPVYATEYGLDGAITVSAKAVDDVPNLPGLVAVRDLFGIRLCAGTCMEPLFQAGDVVFVHPHLPPVPGKSVLLRKQEEGGEILVRELVAQTATEWTVKQYAPQRTETLPKAEWPIGRRIKGKIEA